MLDQALNDRLRDFIISLFGEHPGARVEVGRMLGAEEAALFIEGHRI